MENKMITDFASDNYAGVHDLILENLQKVNSDCAIAYGEDEETAKLDKIVKSKLGTDASIFPVFNGTGANVLALTASLERFQGVICTESSHLNTDEGGAPESVGGIKLYKVSTIDGKLTPTLIRSEAYGVDDIHRAEPKMVSIALSTETGLVYNESELIAIREVTQELGLLLHIDGARIFNGSAGLGMTLWEVIRISKPDVITIGGTKVGAMLAEAVISLNPMISKKITRLRKTLMQLGSKQRFISSQLLTLLENDLGLNLARNANDRLYELYLGIKENEFIKARYLPQANALFIELNNRLLISLRERYRFYVWDEKTNLIRLMTSWRTSVEDVVKLLDTINSICKDLK